MELYLGWDVLFQVFNVKSEKLGTKNKDRRVLCIEKVKTKAVWTVEAT